MELALHQYPVQDVQWGLTTGYQDGQLTINPEEVPCEA